MYKGSITHPCARVTPGSSESTALNNTVQGEPIARVYKYDVIKQTYLLGSQQKYSVWRERGTIQPKPSGAEGRERGEERGKNSQAELKPLEINNWRHSFYFWAQQRWLLKCHLGRNIELKETPLSINYWRSVWLSQLRWGQEVSRGSPPSPGPGRMWPSRRQKRRWEVRGVQMLHCLNTCKICQKYRFIMIQHKTEAGPAAYKTARHSGIHQANQPFIMYAGSWRAGITFIFTALYCANAKEGTGRLHKSGGLGWCHYFH